jgi:hypothetical protein
VENPVTASGSALNGNIQSGKIPILLRDLILHHRLHLHLEIEIGSGGCGGVTNSDQSDNRVDPFASMEGPTG